MAALVAASACVGVDGGGETCGLAAAAVRFASAALQLWLARSCHNFGNIDRVLLVKHHSATFSDADMKHYRALAAQLPKAWPKQLRGPNAEDNVYQTYGGPIKLHVFSIVDQAENEQPK